MEITEKERLMLVEKKDEIRKISLEMYDIVEDETMELKEKKNRIKKDMISIISILDIIGSYAKVKDDNLQRFQRMSLYIFYIMDGLEYISKPAIEIFCNAVNGITFDFSKRSIKIIFPKIDISFLKLER